MRRILTLALPLVAASSLTACSGYYGRGYGGGVAVGYGAPVYDDYWGYYSDYPYWGWYNGFYYPGSGIYVYDQYRRPHSWAPYQRYWTERRMHWQNNPQWQQRRQGFRSNWNGFRQNRPATVNPGTTRRGGWGRRGRRG